MDIEQIPTYIGYALTIIGACASLATLTPNKADDRFFQALLNIINVLGANVGKSKNKDD